MFVAAVNKQKLFVIPKRMNYNTDKTVQPAAIAMKRPISLALLTALALAACSEPEPPRHAATYPPPAETQYQPVQQPFAQPTPPPPPPAENMAAAQPSPSPETA